MDDSDYAKGGQFGQFNKAKSMGSKKCICFTALNLTISTVTCVLLFMVLNSKDAVCLDDDLIVAKDYSQMAVKSIVPESSGDGDWVGDDDDYTFDEPYEPYDFTAHLKPGVEYATAVDGTMNFRAAQFREAQWDPTTSDFGRFGKRYLKKSGMYEYTQVTNTPTNAHYSYKVKMASMIGPDHADQEQFHQVLVNTPRRIVVKVTAKTHNFPYSDAFNIEQIWLLENVDNTKMRLVAKTGIDWIVEPNFMIKGFIEKDISEAQLKMGKYLSSIYSLSSTEQL